ncbi:MAG: glycosyltransferase [Spirochaetota bacterium]|nr:glycosyltransferase [Spirochaetota bacterium]
MKNSYQNIELIVGIPSYMEADNIAFVAKMVDKGIKKYFSDLKAIIVNIDNNSMDDTKGVFLSTDTITPKKYISTPKGVLGKGNNFINLFKFAKKQFPSLKVTIVVDADLKSITPEWVKYLAEPILNGFDYALPRYSRHQFDGTITNHICYPILYGLLGEDLRQPIGGEFGFSPQLIDHWLKEKWLPTTKHFGIDIFMTMNAILGKYKICEVVLGKKVHKASAPKLGAMFTQVVTTFFEKILENKYEWMNLPMGTPKAKPQFGLKKIDPPQEIKIDIRDLKRKLNEEYFQREKLLQQFLNDYAMTRLNHMFEEDYYDMDILMWTQVMYQLLYQYDIGSKRMKKEIVEVLKPLYFARSVTFDYQSWRYNINYAEETILEQAKAFASQKPYLIGLYWKDNKCNVMT